MAPKMKDVLSVLTSGLKPEQQEAITRVFRPKSFTAGTTILKEGDYEDFIFVIQTGKARISRHTSRGQESTVLVASEGDFIGLESLCLEKAEKGIVAVEDMEVLYSPRDTVLHFLNTIPEFAANIIKVLCNRVSTLEERIVNFTSNSLQRRLVIALLKLSENGEVVDGGSVRLAGITHDFLSSLVGASREAVTLALKKLKDARGLQQEGKGVLIVKPKVLQKISESE